MACPVWNGALTQQEERAIERIQRTALAIIRGEEHTTYSEALEYFEMDTLKVRREALCLNFAQNFHTGLQKTKVLSIPEVISCPLFPLRPEPEDSENPQSLTSPTC